MMPLCSRSIAPADALTWVPLEEGLVNHTGLNTRSLQDLQKFMVCAIAAKNLTLTNDEKTRMKKAIGSNNYSARVGLVFKSSSALRPGIGKSSC